MAERTTPGTHGTSAPHPEAAAEMADGATAARAMGHEEMSTEMDVSPEDNLLGFEPVGFIRDGHVKAAETERKFLEDNLTLIQYSDDPYIVGSRYRGLERKMLGEQSLKRKKAESKGDMTDREKIAAKSRDNTRVRAVVRRKVEEDILFPLTTSVSVVEALGHDLRRSKTQDRELDMINDITEESFETVLDHYFWKHRSGAMTKAEYDDFFIAQKSPEDWRGYAEEVLEYHRARKTAYAKIALSSLSGPGIRPMFKEKGLTEQDIQSMLAVEAAA